MKQAQARQVSENPFYGSRSLLAMQRSLEKMNDNNVNMSDLTHLLNNGWSEAKTLEQRQLFFILMFSAGDIENRQHNIFAGKVDQGGHSKRKMFRWCLNWCLKTPSATQYFYQLLPLIAEYTNYENLFYNQLRTDQKTKKVTSHEVLDIDKKKVAEYLVAKIKSGTDFERALIAKFLPKIPMTKRWRKTKEGKSFAQPKRTETLKKDAWNLDLIKEVKLAAGFNSKEYAAWRSGYLKDTEAHLFSSKKICEMDSVEFGDWLEKLPSGARYRVQRRLLSKNDYGVLESNGKWKLKGDKDMGKSYIMWVADKEKAMVKLASLTEEDKKNMSATELKVLKKTAKINTGAETLFESFLQMYSSSYGGTINTNDGETQVKMQQLVDKIKIDVPVLVIVDNSGSMNSGVSFGGKAINRLQLAKFCAAVMMYKNASEDMKSFMMTFNSSATVYHDGGYVDKISGKNRFIQSTTNQRVNTLVHKDKPFIETFKQIDSLFQTTGYTDLTSVSRALKNWVDEDANTKQIKIEAIQAYPVFLVISDGDLNSHSSGKASFEAFQRDMLHWFGATPVIVLWDIVDYSRGSQNFEGLDNFIHVSGMNAAVINQIFLNINDIDILDIYISLKTAFESNRYEPIKQVIN